MDGVDWWARGLAALALVVAGLDFVWRVFEWASSNRLKLKVTGSAGTILFDKHGQPHKATGGRYTGDTLFITVVNHGRLVVVQTVGFRQGDRRWSFVPHVPGMLPTKLSRGEQVTIPSSGEDDTGTDLGLKEAIASGMPVRPYCTTSERRVTGRNDDSFRALEKRLRG